MVIIQIKMVKIVISHFVTVKIEKPKKGLKLCLSPQTLRERSTLLQTQVAFYWCTTKRLRPRGVCGRAELSGRCQIGREIWPNLATLLPGRPTESLACFLWIVKRRLSNGLFNVLVRVMLRLPRNQYRTRNK